MTERELNAKIMIVDDEQANIALLQHIARTIAHTRLQASIGNGHEPPGINEIKGRLFSVANVEFHEIKILNWQEVMFRHVAHSF